MSLSQNIPTSLQILNIESELQELLSLFQQMRELKQKIKISKSYKILKIKFLNNEFLHWIV